MLTSDSMNSDAVPALSPAEASAARRPPHARARSSDPTIPRLESGSSVPLSLAEERLWILDQFSSGLTSYNISRSVRIRGPLDKTALRIAVDGLVARHEPLRTVVVVDPAGPRPVVRPIDETSMPYVETDLLGLPTTERFAAGGRLDATRSAAPSTSPPTCCCVPTSSRWTTMTTSSRSSPTTSRRTTAPESCSGAISPSSTPCAAVENRPPSLPALPVRYADWAAWERSRALAGAFDGDLAWVERRARPCGATRSVDGPAPAGVQVVRRRGLRFDHPDRRGRRAPRSRTIGGRDPVHGDARHLRGAAHPIFRARTMWSSAGPARARGVDVGRPHGMLRQQRRATGRPQRRSDVPRAPSGGPNCSVVNSLEHQGVPFQRLVEELVRRT